jgi:hypothetical protein
VRGAFRRYDPPNDPVGSHGASGGAFPGAGWESPPEFSQVDLLRLEAGEGAAEGDAGPAKKRLSPALTSMMP